jgi:hypothetical protein
VLVNFEFGALEKWIKLKGSRAHMSATTTSFDRACPLLPPDYRRPQSPTTAAPAGPPPPRFPPPPVSRRPKCTHIPRRPYPLLYQSQVCLLLLTASPHFAATIPTSLCTEGRQQVAASPAPPAAVLVHHRCPRVASSSRRAAPP